MTIEEEQQMSKVTAYRIRVYGIVQGVGFRPFTARLARRCGVAGTVCNKGSFVEITAEGSTEQVDAFLRGLKTEAPDRSVILKMDREEISPAGADAFRILRSEERRGDIFVSPDIATCPQCEKELFDPENRRYLHPFINCTACGPRVTILDRMPYDRVRTSMGVFPMCTACEGEYTGPGNRRYHAQPVCCNDCGPELYVLWERNVELQQSKVQSVENSAEENGSICLILAPHSDSTGRRTAPRSDSIGRRTAPRIDSTGRQTAPRIDSAGRETATSCGTEALLRTRDVIRNGGIAAVKGIGGYHLCADASNPEAVQRLRILKKRPFKPFAVMMRDLKTVRETCIVSQAQEEMLTGPNKPILLLQRRSCAADLPGEDACIPQDTVCDAVAPDNPYLGVMLPYAPVQLLLFSYPDGKEMPDALIMTSGNAKDTPICMNDEEALRFLAPLCDIILSNDREIRLRADDSVMNWFAGAPYMIRRSRGYAPLPVVVSGAVEADGRTEEKTTAAAEIENMPEIDFVGEHGKNTPDRQGGNAASEADTNSERKVLGIGGELKNAFCLAKGQFFYLSPYIGNLADVRGREALELAVGRMKELLEIRPDYIVCDLHPRYLSAAAARKMAETGGIPLILLQHHYAHVLSCMAENNVQEPVIGISFDGTGYGTDGTVWGGEFLIADRHGFRRAGSLEPFMQTGGDLAPREGWRIAAALLDDEGRKSACSESACSDSACSDERMPGRMSSCRLAEILGVCSESEFKLVQTMIRQNVNAVTSTSAGRVFDAASAVLGLRRISTSEGEASMVLQYAAERYCRTKESSSELFSAEQPASAMHAMDQTTSAMHAVELPDSALHAVEQTTSAMHAVELPASELAAAARTAEIGTDPETGRFLLPVRWLIRELAERRLDQKQDIDCLAYEFHAAMAELICRGAKMCREQTGIQTAALTGGVMQNTLLLHLLTKRLEADGFQVLRHHLVPANDGGIALGQAYYLPEGL